MVVTMTQGALKMSKDKDRNSFRWAANSYPPAYPWFHAYAHQILSSDCKHLLVFGGDSGDMDRLQAAALTGL